MKQQGKKTGRLSYGHKEPEKSIGLDWDAIREARAKRLDEEIARGIDNEETREHLRLQAMTEAERLAELRKKQEAAVKKSTPKANKTAAKQGGQRGGPRFDVDKMVSLYTEDNMPPKEIAKVIGCNTETVIAWLKKRKVFIRDKHRRGAAQVRANGSTPRSRYCGVCGADLDVPGAANERWKPSRIGEGMVRSGRECVACKRRRGREYWHKNHGKGKGND